MPDELWEKATSLDGLRAGWHLTRAETRSDFIQDYITVESFGYNLGTQLWELRRQLITDTFEPQSLIRVEVPKGAMGVRPGSLLPIPDRTVLYSFVREIAQVFDKLLPDGVYSYRLKEKLAKGELFRESDALEVPFLKKNKIQNEIDPTEAWYTLWPEFNEKTKAAMDTGYSFLSVSDISAYFENISLPILRDLLMAQIPSEQKLINVIMRCFETWTYKTEHGYRPLRGIPQGSNISSFFGNIYLIPLDQHFAAFEKQADVKYYRYMDDVRIFSKDYATARRCLFDMERIIRKLHLNVQSAKTRILDEKLNNEVTNALIDDRMERIKMLREKIKDPKQRVSISHELWKIASEQPKNPSCTKITDHRRPKNDLTLRAFRMWCTTLLMNRDHSYVNHLQREIYRNSDHRLSRLFTNTTRMFPQLLSNTNFAKEFIESAINIFPYQEANFLHALRYQSRLKSIWKDAALKNLLDREKYFYVRVQSCILLSRFLLTEREIQKILVLLADETDEHVIAHLIFPLSQCSEKNILNTIDMYAHHPNARVSIVGLHISKLRRDVQYSSRFMAHVFQKGYPMRICDYLGILGYAAISDDKEILNSLLNYCDAFGPRHPVVDLRPILERLAMQVDARLSALNNLARTAE